MIVNRPICLESTPYYKCLPNIPFAPNYSTLPGLLNVDIFTLHGLLPITKDIYELWPIGILSQPNHKVFSYYADKNIKFQMVLVIANFYALECSNGLIRGRPYVISLMPASKRNKVQEIDVASIKNLDMDELLNQDLIYLNFDPFKGHWDFFGSINAFAGSQAQLDSYTDSIGFVVGAYFLANKYSKRDVLLPGALTSLDQQTHREYRNYRIKRYYTPFKNLEPRKLWGADSPIELFLIQALANEGYFPQIQTSIFRDGSVYANFYNMVSALNIKKEHHKITDADLYFEKERLAIFCDSKQYHSSDETKIKDKNITDKLGEIGINVLRIQGADIVHDLPSCVVQIKEKLSSHGR